MQGCSTEVWAEKQRSDVGVIWDLQRQMFLTQFNNHIISKIQKKLKVNDSARVEIPCGLPFCFNCTHTFICVPFKRLNEPRGIIFVKIAGKDQEGRGAQIQIMLRNNESVTRALPAGFTQRENLRL